MQRSEVTYGDAKGIAASRFTVSVPASMLYDNIVAGLTGNSTGVLVWPRSVELFSSRNLPIQ